MQVKVDDVFSLKSGKYITLEETNYEQERYIFVNKLDENDNPSKKFVVFKCTDKGLLEEKDNDFWLRISQSCLVNPNHIQAVDIRKRFVTLSDGEVESISRDLARKVKKQLIAGGYFEHL